MQASASRIENQNLRLELAVGLLNELVNNPQADLQPQFKKFSSALGQPGALAASIHAAESDMQNRGTVYFAD
ncbi:MAG: hypothetical protein EXS35_13815 [Pedosphaera sp.]|nr:hypothetical protein [Pedosphaera sp.]